MCLAVIALNAHPHYALVIAANRDEYHARAALPAAWWDEGWLAGRDLAGGGTWLALSRTGRWALLTNVREPESRNPAAPTRGALVTAVLKDTAEPVASLTRLAAAATRYNGFNLIAGTVGAAHWLSHRAGGPHRVRPGVHAVSNADLDTPWPKVVQMRDALAQWCAAGTRDPEAVFAFLASRAMAPDEALPRTGVALDWERRLSAAFIVSPEYGTRCSTIVAIGHDGAATFLERTFGPDGNFSGSVEYRFDLSDAA